MYYKHNAQTTYEHVTDITTVLMYTAVSVYIGRSFLVMTSSQPTSLFINLYLLLFFSLFWRVVDRYIIKMYSVSTIFQPFLKIWTFPRLSVTCQRQYHQFFLFEQIKQLQSTIYLSFLFKNAFRVTLVRLFDGQKVE